MHRNFTALVLGAILVFGVGASVAVAQGGGEGTTAQRLEVMRSKLDSMRRSLGSAASSVKSDAPKDDKSKAEDAAARLKGLEKEVRLAALRSQRAATQERPLRARGGA